MYVFFKDQKTFQTVSAAMVLSYRLSTSIYDVVSEAEITTPETLPKEGDIVFFENGFIGILKSFEVNDILTSLKINQIIMLLNRDIFYQEQSFSFLENHIADLITANYINVSDQFYRLPYLTVTPVTETASTMAPDVEELTFNVKSYAAKCRRVHNVFLNWSQQGNNLNIAIQREERGNKNVDLSNPLLIVEEESFSEKTVSKITTFCRENSLYQNWVKLANGSIVNTAPVTGRLNGDWIALIVEKAADVQDSVIDAFAKNSYSHKVVFSAPKNYPLQFYDKITLQKNNALYSSYISGVEIRSDSERMTYTCGELQTVYPFLNLA